MKNLKFINFTKRYIYFIISIVLYILFSICVFKHRDYFDIEGLKWVLSFFIAFVIFGVIGVIDFVYKDDVMLRIAKHILNIRIRKTKEAIKNEDNDMVKSGYELQINSYHNTIKHIDMELKEYKKS